eukprot:jgi/Tetstr1/458143/TSEL_044635.t1
MCSGRLASAATAAVSQRSRPLPPRLAHRSVGRPLGGSGPPVAADRQRRWLGCATSLQDHTEAKPENESTASAQSEGAEQGMEDVLEGELRWEAERQSQVGDHRQQMSAEGQSLEEPLGVMATISIDDGDSDQLRKLPMSDMVRKLVKSDIVLLLDIVGTLLLCACFALDTLPLNEFETDLVHALELDTTFYFTMLYLARWYSKGLKLNFMLRPLSLVDLVSLMPLILGDSFRSAAFLRVLRILKIARLLQEEELSQLLTLVTGHKVEIRDYQLTLVQAAFTLFSVIFVTAGVIYEMETSAGLETFSSFFDALYFSITTLTTVGFGDIVPQSAGGKAFVSAAILVYTVLIPYELGLLANSLGLMNSRQEKEPAVAAKPSLSTVPGVACKACGATEHQSDAKFCRKCGKTLRAHRQQGPLSK